MMKKMWEKIRAGRVGRALSCLARFALWAFAGVGVLVTLAMILMIVLTVWIVRKSNPETKKSNQEIVAVYQYAGPISEGYSNQSLLQKMSGGTNTPTFFEITQSLKKAVKDANVRAVVFDLTQTQFELNQLEEIQPLLRDIRAAGKDVWVYSESYDVQAAMLGGVSNHFALLPEADSQFRGISAQRFYFKGLLDRLGVQAQVIHIGEFKSYGEEYYRTEPSEAAAAQQRELIDSMQQNVLQEVAATRGKTVTDVQTLMDQGEQTVSQLTKNDWADHSWYRTRLNEELKKQYPKAELSRDYEIAGDEHAWKSLVTRWDKKKSSLGGKDYVAVVVMEGSISDETIRGAREALLELSQDEHAKAVVLRVNSPGGSALSSDVLWEATQKWKATKRPFIVSMGGVAASGGYYISAGADQIFADPSTITGSIGVVGMKFELGGVMKSLGVTSSTIERGKFAGINRMDRAYNEEEVALIRQSMERVYGVFKSRVQTGRGPKLQGELESLAGGRVYAGTKAKTIGLVDQLGGLQDAIAFAKKSAKIGDEVEVNLFPKYEMPFDELLNKKSEGDVLVSRVKSSDHQPWMDVWQKQMADRTVPAAMRKPLLNLWQQMVESEHCQVWLLAPTTTVSY